jgi:hypothetical protein
MQSFKSYFLLFSVLLSINCTYAGGGEFKPVLPIVSGQYELIRNVEKLPTAINKYFRSPIFCTPISDPESDFQSECGTKLLNAGTAGNIWFVDYIRGGSGITRILIAYKLNENKIVNLKAQYVTHIVSFEELTNSLEIDLKCVSSKENWLQYEVQRGYDLCP